MARLMQTSRGLWEINAQLLPHMRDLMLKTARSLQGSSINVAQRDLETEASLNRVEDYVAQYEYAFLNLLYSHAMMLEGALSKILEGMNKGQTIDPKLIQQYSLSLEKIKHIFKNVARGKKFDIQKNKTIALQAISLQKATDRKLRNSAKLLKQVERKLEKAAERVKESLKQVKVR